MVREGPHSHERSCSGRTALVTGGSRGIGRAIALRLAAEGAAVAIVARDFEGGRWGRTLDETLAELRPFGPSMALKVDLARPEDRETAVAAVESQLGPVDILVNNAARIGFGSFLQWTDSQLREMQEVNVWAPWHLLRRVLPGMLARRSGSVVNVASKASLPNSNVLVGGAAYGGTKAMLVQMTRCVAAELRNSPIVVNSLTPHGASETEGIANMVRERRFDPGMVEPVEAMAEAALALATVPPGETDGGLYTSLEYLAAIGRPVRDLQGEAILPGYEAVQLHDRMQDMELTRTRPIDLRPSGN